MSASGQSHCLTFVKGQIFTFKYLLIWLEERNFVQMGHDHVTKLAAMSMYSKTPLKIFCSENKLADDFD